MPIKPRLQCWFRDTNLAKLVQAVQLNPWPTFGTLNNIIAQDIQNEAMRVTGRINGWSRGRISEGQR